MEKIIEHKFRNRCLGDCFLCEKEDTNECSVVINDWGTTCNRPRSEHLESHHEILATNSNK